MILDKNGETFIYHGITYSIGHQVLATSQSEYKGLYVEQSSKFGMALIKRQKTVPQIFTVHLHHQPTGIVF